MKTYVDEAKTVLYSDNFLEQLRSDIWQLAADRERAGVVSDAALLLRASKIIANIKRENED